MKRLHHITYSFLIGLLLIPGLALGEPLIIYDGLGDRRTFQATSFLHIGGELFTHQEGKFSQAQSFTLPSSKNYYLTSLDIALTSKVLGEKITVQILGNKQEGRKQAPWNNYILETFHVTLSPLQTYSGFPNEESLITLTSAQGPLLIAGETYWVVLTSDKKVPADGIQWWDSSVTLGSSVRWKAQRVNDTPWTVGKTDGPGQAFRINGNPVPEQDIPGFSFKSIADTGGMFQQFDKKRTLSLNNQDTVAFWGTFDNGHQGIFTGNGTALSFLSTSKSRNLGIIEFGAKPSINSANTVAFLGTHRDHFQRLFIQGKGLAQAIATEHGPFHHFGEPSINGQGTVVFLAGLQGHGGGIFSLHNGKVQTIANTEGHFSGFFEQPMINEKGTIVFTGKLHNGKTGIYTSKDGHLTSIVETSERYKGFGAPTVNDRGTVAFWACMDQQQPSCPQDSIAKQGVFIGNGGRITTVATSEGPFRAFGNPSINNKGQVAFVGTLDSGVTGIFTGPHPVRDQVIKTGDPLMGSQVHSLQLMQGVRINDNHTIAFFAQLTNGIEGIFLATP